METVIYGKAVKEISIPEYKFLSIGVLPRARNVRGVQAGLNAAADNVYGVQAGLVASADNVHGVQAGVLAGAENDVYGVQAGVLAGADNVRGVQIAPLSIIADGEKSDAVQLGLLLLGPGNKRWNPSVFYQRVRGKEKVRHLGTLERIVKSFWRGF